MAALSIIQGNFEYNKHPYCNWSEFLSALSVLRSLFWITFIVFVEQSPNVVLGLEVLSGFDKDPNQII